MNQILRNLTLDQGKDGTTKDVASGQLVLKFSLIILQLVVLCWLESRYAVEEYLGLPDLIPVVLAGFVVHSLLPMKFRMPFFVLLGVGATFWLLNWIPALMILALVAFFFGILQLPFSVRVRAIILLFAGIVFAALWVMSPQSIPGSYKVVPIVGSMFMFRASLYLHEIRFEKKPAPLIQQLGYFLMFPNLILTLFPAVDYKLFQKTYYDRAPLEIYQKGVRWMIRGFFHLMIYRIVYYYVQPNVLTVESLGEISAYFVTTYLLMIRLSGLFHTSAGILGLFGFNLPALFHNYYLASGFSDVWRRINTYWRDYVMKVLYYPIYFKLRKYGKQTGMVITILIVFVLSWLLHSYQWFWLKGDFPVRAVDAVFWISWGGLVAINSVIQTNASGKKKSASSQSINTKVFIRALQTVGMFSFMTIFWTMWSSPSLGDWWGLIVKALGAPGAEWLQLGLQVIGLIIAVTIGYRIFEIPKVKAFMEPDEGKSLSVFWGGLTLAIFALLTVPTVLNSFQGLTDKPVEHVYKTKLNEQDDADMIRGYYEDLLITNQLSSPLADMQNIPADWVKFAKMPAVTQTGDWMRSKLLPNKSTKFKSEQFTTNEWGMRDKSYSKVKEEGHYRIGIAGGSYVMGSGVKDADVFEVICEDALNESNPYGYQFDLLNFATANYHLLHLTKKFREGIIDFDLDAVIFVSQGIDLEKAGQTAMQNLKAELPIDLDYVMDIMEEAGYTLGTRKKLRAGDAKQVNYDLVNKSYELISQICAENNIKPILVYWPRTDMLPNEEDIQTIFELARNNGFTVLDFSDVFDDYTVEDIRLAPYDSHPNALGHKLIADRLYKEIISNPEVVEIIEAGMQQ